MMARSLAATVFLLAALAARSAAATLPGYAAPSLLEPAAPPAERILGYVEDPLERLTADGEDLRDAVASPPAADWLQRGLRSPDQFTRAAAIRAAAVPRRVEGVPHLTGVLLRLDETVELRSAAAMALGRIGEPLAATALSEALSDPAQEVRYAAALALGRLRSDGAATRLERALRTDPSWWVRYAAAVGLGRLRKSFVIASLEDRLRAEAYWQVRLQTVRALQEIASPRAADVVVVALQDRDAGVRAAAAFALGEIGADRHLPAVGNALRAETDASSRGILTAAFRRILSRP